MRDVENLSSLQLEKVVLASLFEFPDVISETENCFSEKDFTHVLHSACFSLLREAHGNNQAIDPTILAQKLSLMGLKTFEELDIFSYLNSISYNKVASKEILKEYIEELIKLHKLRDMLLQTEKAKRFILENKEKPLDYLYTELDKINNEVVSKYNNKAKLVNIFSDIKEKIEARVDAPPDKFLTGPFKTINDIYGTLLPPASLNVIGARSGVSKTALSMFYLLHIAERYDLPILHLDFSEMTLEQLQFRAVCSFTNGIVPYHSLFRGTWKKHPEWERLVKKVWPRVQKLRMFYYDVGSMTQQQQLSLIKRVYYKEVGRGNDMLLNYDYLKPFDSDNLNSPEWKVMGHFIQDYKSLVNNEIPQIRGWFSLQVNRLGITNNKSSSQVDDSENTFGISDRIMQQSTSSFLIRQKTHDEISAEANRFGDLKMIPVKFREVLGDQWERHFKWIKTHTGAFRKNYINLKMRAFYFEDMGDLQVVTDFLNNQVNINQAVEPTNNF